MLETSCGVFRNISASNVVRHPKYVGGAYYDVAVVHVEKRFPFNKFIKPICLPEQNDSNLDRHKGQLMRLAGTISLVVLNLQKSCILIVFLPHRLGKPKIEWDDFTRTDDGQYKS